MTTQTLFAPLATIADDARKRFDDAIYQRKHNTTTTAADLWAELKVAQETPGFASGFTCMGILNELKDRKQIPAWR